MRLGAALHPAKVAEAAPGHKRLQRLINRGRGLVVTSDLEDRKGRMERGVWILKIKKGREEEYREAHKSVWADLVQASRSAGFRNHSVFLSGSTVIAYLEAESISDASARLRGEDVKHCWDIYMSKYLESTDSPFCEEVFHFD